MEFLTTCSAAMRCFDEQAQHGSNTSTGDGVIHISSLRFSLCYSSVSFVASQGHEINISGTVSLSKSKCPNPSSVIKRQTVQLLRS